MPIVVSNTTFADEFSTGTASELNCLLGDVITATHTVYYENSFDASLDASWSIEPKNDNDSDVLGAQGSGRQCFNIVGVSNIFSLEECIGQEITVSGFNNASLNTTYTVVEIAANNVLVTSTSHISSSSGGKGSAVLSVTSDIVDVTLITSIFNNSGNTVSSPIKIGGGSNEGVSNETTTSPLDAGSASVITIPYKYDGAYQTGSLTIAGVSKTATRQTFTIVNTFFPSPLSISDIQISGSTWNSILPQSYGNLVPYNDLNVTSMFDVTTGNGRNNYKLNIDFKRTPTSYQNLSTIARFRNPITSVQSFGRRVGGGSTNYSVSNLSIVRTSDSTVTDKPIRTEKFTVSFDVDSTVTPFSNSNTKVKVHIEHVPENTIDNTQDYEGAFLYDRALTTLGAGATTGIATGDSASITNYTATFNSTSQISVSFDVEYTANAQTQIDLAANPIYAIWVTTQDHTTGYTDSDRVNLKVYADTGIDRVLVDPITVNNTQFITSPYQDFSTGIDAAEIDGFPVQMLCSATEFSANWTSREDLRIDKITQLLVLKNSNTLEEINLDTTSIPVNTFTLISGEYPSANYSVQKGFKIPSTEVRNLIEMTNVSDISSVRTFEARFPFFIRWEDYTELIMSEIPSTILDTSEPFDGRNYDVNRIDDLTNWSLNYRITIDCSESGTTFSQDFDYTIPTTGYNEHPDVTARSITSYKPDGVTLQPTLSSGKQAINSVENTWIKYEATFSSAPSAITDFEIEIFAEVFENGSPVRIERISSVNNLLSSSWFTDTGAGDGLILKSIDGSKAVGDCLIDFSKLAKFDNYRLYGQIYSPKRPTEYLLAEDGDNLASEAGDKFIRDF
jgi:hypothetical protein